MSASTKAEQLLQRMNRRTTNTASSVDEGIDQKKDILETIVGAVGVPDESVQGPAVVDQVQPPIETTTDRAESLASVALTGSDDKTQVEVNSTFENGMGHQEVKETSDIDLSKGLASIADQVVREIKSKKTKKDTHRKATYELPIELLERFDRIASLMKEPRGFKERTIQHLLERFCDEMEVQLQARQKQHRRKP
ncbi:hypothetical protein [Alicyclobacillus macrosporangiidus]|uniref:Uncharacterized protein n=1 Tax=Alicyclobacillus macrosporangiidus TaxID=392015 RepID=A0A1I7KCR3_9BACL|nr:hypothetical protein [Alicyclobacillus macrosporangiidus]SFU95189.1 hypothetical protein SAMN05421543_11534 [Alicyclobacillus macrosporangiidus]